MPAIKCNCGQILRYSLIPNPIEWLMIAEVDYIDMYQKSSADELYQALISILQCDQCGRLWIYHDGFQKAPTPYLPDKGHLYQSLKQTFGGRPQNIAKRYLFISDEDFDCYVDQVQDLRPMMKIILQDEKQRILWVYWTGESGDPICYYLEKDKL